MLHAVFLRIFTSPLPTLYFRKRRESVPYEKTDPKPKCFRKNNFLEIAQMSNSIARRGSQAAFLSMIAALLIVFCAGLTTAIAQDTQEQPSASGQEMGHHMGGHRGMPSADDQLKHLSKKLSLSDDQRAKLKPILEDQHKQMQQLWNDSSMSRQDRFSKMRELRENGASQIKSVLKDDQQKKFDAMREEQRSHMHHGMHGGQQPGGNDSQQQ
jgi:periplasmic protein CpxP/Spy